VRGSDTLRRGANFLQLDSHLFLRNAPEFAANKKWALSPLIPPRLELNYAGNSRQGGTNSYAFSGYAHQSPISNTL
jgi:hypothetical protein